MTEKRKEVIRSIKFVLFSISAGVIQIGSFTIMEEFLQRQKQVYALDFQDLIYFTLDIFDRCPEVLEKWQDRLNYIQVDECYKIAEIWQVWKAINK